MDDNFQTYVLSKLETSYSTISEFMDDAYFYKLFSIIVEFGLGHLWGGFFQSLFDLIPHLTMNGVRFMFEPVIQHFFEQR